MNPVTAQRVSVTTADGLALETRQIGPEVADTTVILLHGLLGDRDSWRHQTSHLTSRHPDIRVIAYDQRGHGRSGRGCALSNTIGQLAGDLDAVIDMTTPTGRIVLVGHSMGATRREGVLGPPSPVTALSEAAHRIIRWKGNE